MGRGNGRAAWRRAGPAAPADVCLAGANSDAHTTWEGSESSVSAYGPGTEERQVADNACQIAVDCRSEGGGYLLIRPREPADKLVTLDIVLGWRKGCLRASSEFYGYDLEQFVGALTEMRRQLDGVARLANFCGEVEITFRVADRARGRIAVAGHIAQRVILSAEARQYEGHPPLLEFGFGGLYVDQSYLPHMARTLSEYLRLTELSTEHPLQH